MPAHELNTGIRAIVRKDDTVLHIEKLHKDDNKSVVVEEVYNYSGDLISKTEKPFESFTSNFLKMLFARMTGLPVANPGKNMAGADKNYTHGRESNLKSSTQGSGLEKLGLCLFSTLTLTDDTYTGTLVTGLIHGPTRTTVVVEESDRLSFCVSKRFDNRTTGVVTVAGVGLVSQSNAVGEIDSMDNTLLTVDSVVSTSFATNTYRIYTLKIYTSKDFFVTNFLKALNTISGSEGTVYASPNGKVLCVAIHPITGHLYVGGAFTAIGSVQANRIAYWDGSEWRPLAGGVS